MRRAPREVALCDREIGGWYRLATRGWSGNERIICAMQDNLTFWEIAWMASFRGGLTVFRLDPKIEAGWRAKAARGEIPSTAGYMRKQREPVPESVCDALAAACEAFGDSREDEG